jgi:hypothetical protein
MLLPARFLPSLALALLCTAHLALADTAPTGAPTADNKVAPATPKPPEKVAPTTPKEVEVKETTEVHGTLSSGLIGRWLVISLVKTPEGVMPVGRTWEIRNGTEHLELVLHRRPLPPKVNDKLTTAARAGKPWTPEPADLREVDETWDTLPPMQASYSQLEHKIAAKDVFPAEFEGDEATKGALLAISVRETSAGQIVARTTSLYGVREQTPTTLSGTFVTTSLAMAMMPIPITLRGDFKAYRVGEPPACAWYQRWFSGCPN